ncbi:MAG: DUF6526 family protein [Acidobacteriota bacterium]
MADRAPQSYANHARLVPAYHFVAFPLFAINLLYWVYVTVTRFSWGNLIGLGTATALVILFFVARVMALTVQDRVIRLEERLRMRELLPADLNSRINDFTVEQLVGLRFAGDEELPALARRVLDEKLTDRKVIKQLVRNWRADHQRC